MDKGKEEKGQKTEIWKMRENKQNERKGSERTNEG